MSIAHAYSTLVQRFLAESFPFWQRLGLHITPIHFYQPIPDTRTLREELWTSQSELVGIDMREADQLQLLGEFAAAYADEYEALPAGPTPIPHQYYRGNPYFGAVDGEMLYCFIRRYRPAHIVEIGSGMSTLLAAEALRRNEADGFKGNLRTIEPYPSRLVQSGVPGLSEVIMAPVQQVPLSLFTGLEQNDILFIDSSHVLTIGSDVQYEYLEIAPRLKAGVLMHIHDIFLPAEYPREWVLEAKRFWNEQYLLQAFLTFNECFRVLWAASYMRLRHSGALRQAFAMYEPGVTRPGSFWIRKLSEQSSRFPV